METSETSALTLGPGEILPLLEALRSPEEALGVAALRALVRLPLDDDAWRRVGHDVALALDRQHAGRPVLPAAELFEAAALVPVRPVRERLRRTVEVAGPELREAGLRALILARDAAAVGRLLEDPSAAADPWLWSSLPAIATHEHIPALQRGLASLEGDDPDTLERRWWVALALARQGEDAALRSVWQEIAPDRLPLLWGDPALAAARLRAAGPFPKAVRDWLSGEAQGGALTEELVNLARWLSESAPQEPEPEPARPAASRPAPSPEAHEKALQEADRLLQAEHVGPELLQAADALLLAALEEDAASLLLAALLKRVADGAGDVHAPLEIVAGNGLVELAWELDWHLLPNAPQLLSTYARLREVSPALAEQVGWLVGRSGLGAVTRALIESVGAGRSLEERIAAAQLLEDVLHGVGRSGPPVFGAGGAEATEPGPPHRLLEDEYLEGFEDLTLAPGEAQAGAVGPPAERKEAALAEESDFERLLEKGLGQVSGVLLDEVLEATVMRPPMPESSGEAVLQEVLLGASAPERVPPEGEFTARFVAYIEGLEEEARERLTEASPRAVPHLGMKRCRWRPGAEVTVVVGGRHLEVDEPSQCFAWGGRLDDLEFDVAVEAGAPEGFTVLKYDIYIEQVRVAKLRLDLEISRQRAAGGQRRAEARPAATAFASYSSQDRERVLDRVSAVQISAGLKVFQDCLSLHPGEAWKPRLEEEIHDSDLFLLFWSRHAAASPWVEWEWTTALEVKGVEAFQFHPLDPVKEAPPPPRLADLHFGDPLMIIRAYEAGRAG